MSKYVIGDEVKIVRHGMPRQGDAGKVVSTFEVDDDYKEYVVKFENETKHRYLETDLAPYNRKIEGFLKWLTSK